MGGFHRAGTGKNKKVIEISPLLAFWPERAKEWKFKKFISLVRNGLFQILFLLSVPKILKNCLKIVEEKSMAKSCNREICYFPHPIQASSTKICLQVKSSHCCIRNVKKNKQFLLIISTIIFFVCTVFSNFNHWTF